MPGRRSSSRRRRAPPATTRTTRTAAAAAAAATPFVHHQRRVFLLTYLVYVLFYFTKKPFSVVKTDVARELGLDMGQLGLVDTAFLACYAAGQFMIGPFGDKYGARRMLLVSLGGATCACLLMARAASFRELQCAWGLNGLFQAMAFPLIMKALAPWFTSAERGTVLGFWTTCQQVGGMSSAAFTGFVAGGGTVSVVLRLSGGGGGGGGAASTWRDTFAFPAGLACVAALAVHQFLVEAPEDVGLSLPAATAQTTTTAKKTKKATTTKKASAAPAAAPAGFWDVVRLPYLLNVGASYFCIKLVRYTMLGWLATYLMEVCGLDVAAAAYLSTLFDIGGAFGAVACGAIAQRWFSGDRIRTVLVLCLLTGASTAGFMLVGGDGAGASQVPVIVAMLVSGFFVAGPDSVLGGAACADVCERAGYGSSVLTTASGIANGMGSLGSILAGSVPVLIKEAYGWEALFATMGMLSAAGAAALVPLAIAPTEKPTSSKSKTKKPKTA